MATTRSDFTPMDEPEREPLTPAQVDALTEALNQLTERIGDASRQAAGQPAGTAAASPPTAPTGPWWFKGSGGYPGAPNYDPSFMPTDPAHRQWWSRSTAGTAGGMGGGGMPPGNNVAGAAGDEPDPDDFSFVRSFWRRKAERRAQRRAERETAASGGGGGRPPWWNRYTEAAGGEDGPPEPEGWLNWRGRPFRRTKPGPGERGATVAERMSVFGARLPQFGTEERGATEGEKEAVFGPFVKAWSVAWNRKRKKAPWHWGSFTRKAGAWARMRFGKRGQRMAVSGLATAAGRLARGWSPHAALRAGAFAGAAAGGGATLGMAALALGAFKASEALNQLTRDQVNNARTLAHSSAQMAQVIAQRDLLERLRQREVGDRLADSSRVTTQAEQMREESTKEIGIAWDHTKNTVSSAWEIFKTVLFTGLNEQLTVLNKMWEWFEGGGSDRVKYLTMGEWAQHTQQLDEEARKRKDPKWDPPKHGQG